MISDPNSAEHAVYPLSRRKFVASSLGALLAATMTPSSAMGATDQGFRPPPTPQDFGALADGLSNDSPALTAWLNHLIQHDVSGYVPAGDYMMHTAVRVRLSKTVRIGLVGAGSHVSRFLVHPNNRQGGFDINAFNSRRHQLQLEGFSITALGNSAIGFRFNMPEGGNQHQRSLVMDDVWCRGANHTTDHFKTAFDFTGCWRPRIQNSGWDGPFINVDNQNASARFYCDTAFNLDGCYGLSIEDCFAWGCRNGITSRVFDGQIVAIKRARGRKVRVILGNGPMPFSMNVKVRIRGTKNYNGTHVITRVSPQAFEIDATYAGSETGHCALAQGPEGMSFKDNTINGVMNGIWVERPNGREPTCWINGNHINYRDFGIVLDGVKLLQMDQNNTYNEDGAEHFAGTPKDIDLRNVSEYIIGAHVFHFDGHSRRVGIRVASETRGEGDNGLIHRCIFSGKFQIGIHLTRNASGVRIGPNLFPGKIGQNVWDENGQNIVE